MKFEDIIEGEFYKTTAELSFVFYYADGQETLVRFEEGTVVQVLAKVSTEYGGYCAAAPRDYGACEAISDALIDAHILEPLKGEGG